MKELEGIKNIIFDLGGVILNIDYQITVEAFKKLGIDDFEEIFSQYKQSTLSDDFETGRITELEFYEGIKTISGKDFTFEEYKNAWNALLLDLPKERINILKKLSEKYRLFLFSNTNETHYKEFVTKVESDFNTIFEKTYYSHQFGKRKPDSDSFLSILKENNLIIEETLFVDDSIQHIESANLLGIRTLLIQEKPITELFD
ncbi:MAG: HAD family phosphatase [Flavobacteriales bacterium]|nr:HAD family phosphatase [Flavobacteriales bacterium]